MNKLLSSIILALALQTISIEHCCQAKGITNEGRMKNFFNSDIKTSIIIGDSTRDSTSQHGPPSFEDNIFNLHEDNFDEKISQHVYLRFKKSNSKVDDDSTAGEDYLIDTHPSNYEKNIKYISHQGTHQETTQKDIVEHTQYEIKQHVTTQSILNPTESTTEENDFWSTLVIVNPDPDGQYDHRPEITIHSTNRCQPGEVYESGECRIID